tara:strand:- start:492 stop:1028 length:537 start_codon:yes stop_codon:yes gene_type:complete
MSDDEDDELDLDVSWIEMYKDLEKNYDDFYKEKPENIEMIFLYINQESKLETINTTTYILDLNGSIPKNNLINIIKEHRYKNGKKYSLKNILKYNITLEPEDVIHMLSVDNKEGEAFLSQESYNRDICFADTVCILQNLNSLYFIFNETLSKSQRQEQQLTRKIKPIPATDKTRRKRI